MPRLRLLLVMDNLTGHSTPSLVLWLLAHGIMPRYTPLGGSWLLASSVNGQVFSSSDAGDSWSTFPREFGEVHALAWVPN